MNFEIRQLKHFNDALKRDILTDALASPVRVPDDKLLMRVINYGNAFLEREKERLGEDAAVIWFDIHFGEPAQVGITWAYNPNAPFDDLYGESWFWRMWSQTIGSDKDVYTLERVQKDFAEYTLQHVS